MSLETRVVEDEGIELRSEGDVTKIVGYAAVFNSPTTDRFAEVHGFSERIAPGAFADVISSKQDVRAFFAHDEAKVLGRASSGTLTLREDARGLYCEIVPPNTQAGRDAIESIRRGDITGMSFRAPTRHIKDSFKRENGKLVRTISKIGRLVEVSPVSIPAYDNSTVSLRSLDEFLEEERRASLQMAKNRLRLADCS